MAPEHLQPIATASLPWQIVLAIIAFNVIAGLMSKRKKRPPKAEPIPGSQGDPKGDAKRRLEEAQAQAAAERERKAAEREANRERDEGRVSARSQSGSSRTQGTAASPAQDPGAKAKEAGRDLLGQLARELGLELPEPAKPVPPARPAPASRPAPAARPVSGSKPNPAQSRPGSVGPIATRQAAGREREEEGSAPPKPVPLAPPEPVRPEVQPLALELSNAESLRKAFILKTVLDKPLSLQPRR